MTEVQVTWEPLRIESLEDVAGIDDNTNNRAAVRSLRHGAREALLRAAKWDGYKVLTHAAAQATSLGCTGEENRENWIALLSERDNRIDVAVNEAIGTLDGVKERILGEVALAKACLAKAEAILRAHPEGLPQDAAQHAMYGYDPYAGESLEDDEDDEDDVEI